MNRRIGQKLCDFYITHAKGIGAAYCILPVLGWLAFILLTVPFREVYALRIAISIIIGAPLAAYMNNLGVSLWTAKHCSKFGPGKIFEGTIIGACIGTGIAIIPSLTSLILSNDIEQAKTFIIVSWVVASVLGAIIGTIISAFGKKYINCKKISEQ